MNYPAASGRGSNPQKKLKRYATSGGELKPNKIDLIK